MHQRRQSHHFGLWCPSLRPCPLRSQRPHRFRRAAVSAGRRPLHGVCPRKPPVPRAALCVAAATRPPRRQAQACGCCLGAALRRAARGARAAAPAAPADRAETVSGPALCTCRARCHSAMLSASTWPPATAVTRLRQVPSRTHTLSSKTTCQRWGWWCPRGRCSCDASCGSACANRRAAKASARGRAHKSANALIIASARGLWPDPGPAAYSSGSA